MARNHRGSNVGDLTCNFDAHAAAAAASAAAAAAAAAATAVGEALVRRYPTPHPAGVRNPYSGCSFLASVNGQIHENVDIPQSKTATIQQIEKHSSHF